MKIPENFIAKQFAANPSFDTAYTGTIVLNSVASMVAGTAGDKQRAVVKDDLASPTKVEIIYFTTINTGTKTIDITDRAQEGTTAQDWSGGGYITQDVTKELLEQFAELDADNTMSGDNTFSGTAATQFDNGVTTGDTSSAIAGALIAVDGSTAKPGYLVLYDDDSTPYYVFFDTDGNVRVHTSVPTANTDGNTVRGRRAIGLLDKSSTGTMSVAGLDFMPSTIEFCWSGGTGPSGTTPVFNRTVIQYPNTQPTISDITEESGIHYVELSSSYIGYLNYTTGTDTEITFTSWNSDGFTVSLDALHSGTTLSGYYIAYE
jgi:hypothetical protein